MENNLKNQHYKNMSITLQMEILTFEAERTYSSIMGNYKYRTCFSCATISSL